MKPLGKVSITWSSALAYAIGLIVTDGSLSKDGRHINLTSKDRDQLETFMRCLGVSVKIGTKRSGFRPDKLYFQVQIGDILFYRFLQSIGLTPAKTKTIGAVAVPDEYFSDFLRGHLDGDGSTHSYFDPRWPTSFLCYTTFLSASQVHIQWLQTTIQRLIGVSGKVSMGSRVLRVRYAKADSLKIFASIYAKRDAPCLERKRLKIARVFGMIAPDALPGGLRQ